MSIIHDGCWHQFVEGKRIPSWTDKDLPASAVGTQTLTAGVGSLLILGDGAQVQLSGQYLGDLAGKVIGAERFLH